MSKSNGWPIGLTIVGTTTVYRVQIDGRGGDSEHDEEFATQKEAEGASLVDGSAHKVQAVEVYKMSDGSLMSGCHEVRLSKGPSKEELEEAANKLAPGLLELLRD